MSFKEGFLWGAASASAQVEGAFDEDGKCLSVWDLAGKHVKTGEDCKIACDHYHRYAEDVALMKEIGLNSYRFSVSMCRIMPEEGKINEDGFRFYIELLKELKKADITPICTLYHWDLPAWAQEKGGWKNPKIIDWYLMYVEATVKALDGYVDYWVTFNEPQCFLFFGYITGEHAPFKKDLLFLRRYVKNMLLSHGKAVRLIRKTASRPVKIGVAMVARGFIPKSDSEKDILKAEKAAFRGFWAEATNTIFTDPILLGKATMIMKGCLKKADLEIISSPVDFLGLNVYQPMNDQTDRKAYSAENHPRTMMGWAIDARCLYHTVKQFYDRYNVPIMVTENGMACPDEVKGGEVVDEDRVNYITEYLRGLKKAADEGVPVLGYQYWSLTDNFEWCEGYRTRFGLIHIDFATQKRTLKKSAYTYSEIIRSNGESL